MIYQLKDKNYGLILIILSKILKRKQEHLAWSMPMVGKFSKKANSEEIPEGYRSEKHLKCGKMARGKSF